MKGNENGKGSSANTDMDMDARRVATRECFRRRRPHSLTRTHRSTRRRPSPSTSRRRCTSPRARRPCNVRAIAIAAAAVEAVVDIDIHRLLCSFITRPHTPAALVRFPTIRSIIIITTITRSSNITLNPRPRPTHTYIPNTSYKDSKHKDSTLFHHLLPTRRRTPPPVPALLRPWAACRPTTRLRRLPARVPLEFQDQDRVMLMVHVPDPDPALFLLLHYRLSLRVDLASSVRIRAIRISRVSWSLRIRRGLLLGIIFRIRSR